MITIGKQAHKFVAEAVVEGNKIVSNFSLDDLLKSGEVLLLFYPKDFTFVCPTELIAIQQRYDEFLSRKVSVVACSTDSAETHLAWLNIPINQGGIQGIKYPIVSDLSKTISMNYNVLAGNYIYDEEGESRFEGNPVAYRGTFFIDRTGIVRYMSINDMPMGRSVDEMLRIVDMWHTFCTKGEVCPANWTKGHDTLKPNSDDLKRYSSQNYK